MLGMYWTVKHTNQRPGGVAPISYGMGVYLALDTFTLHLIQAGLQYLVASRANGPSHIFYHYVLQPINLLQAFEKASRNVFASLPRI